MREHGKWYERIEKEIASSGASLTGKERKKYKLDHLLKVAGRVEEFSPSCGECQLKQQEIEQLVQELVLLLQTPGKQALKSYRKKSDAITKHLQKVHKLVPAGYYKGIWTGTGVAIGTGASTALGNPAIGSGLGIAIGLAVGSYLDKKAEKEGRVL